MHNARHLPRVHQEWCDVPWQHHWHEWVIVSSLSWNTEREGDWKTAQLSTQPLAVVNKLVWKIGKKMKKGFKKSENKYLMWSWSKSGGGRCSAGSFGSRCAFIPKVKLLKLSVFRSLWYEEKTRGERICVLWWNWFTDGQYKSLLSYWYYLLSPWTWILILVQIKVKQWVIKKKKKFSKLLVFQEPVKMCDEKMREMHEMKMKDMKNGDAMRRPCSDMEEEE